MMLSDDSGMSKVALLLPNYITVGRLFGEDLACRGQWVIDVNGWRFWLWLTA